MTQPLNDARAGAVDDERAPRLARLVREHSSFVWRLLRRIGLARVEAESALQEVFGAASQRIGDIRLGSERAFLFSTTLHVAARVRRDRAEGAISHTAAESQDDEQSQARDVLDALLGRLPLELRAVFILCEIERFPESEAADVIGIPVSSVSSRVSDARREFASQLQRHNQGEPPERLLAAAREERATEHALARALAATSRAVSALVDVHAEVDSVSAPGPHSAAAAHGRASTSPLKLFVKWLILGWLVGLLGAALAYAVSDAGAPATPHDTPSR